MTYQQAISLARKFVAQAKQHHSEWNYACTDQGKQIIEELKQHSYWISNTQGEYRLRNTSNTVDKFLEKTS